MGVDTVFAVAEIEKGRKPDWEATEKSIKERDSLPDIKTVFLFLRNSNRILSGDKWTHKETMTFRN